MTEKTKNLWQEIIDVFKKIWSYITTAWVWLCNHSIGKFLGIVITVFASFVLVVEIIMALLLLGDPYQTQELIKVFTGISIFSYISLFEYYGFFLGGIMLDLALITMLLWFGIWLWNGDNYFVKPKYAWFYACCVAFIGLLGLVGSLFNMAPELINLKKQMHQQFHETKRLQYLPADVRYEFYYPNQNQYYRAQREAQRLEQEIQNRINREFYDIWYR